MARRIRGLGVSPGVAIGRVLLLQADVLPVVPQPVPPERVEREIERFHRAREQARAEIRELKERVLVELGEHYAGILEAQVMILDDPRMVQETVQRIKAGRVTAEWSLKEVVSGFMRRFDAVNDPYIRERGGELADVHRRLQRLLRGGPRRASEMPEGPLVVVAHNLGPSDAVALARRGIVGLATDAGGRTSHTAILAQALSVPAVAGLHDVSAHASNGDLVILDGDSGEVQLLPSEEEREQAEERRRDWLAREERRVGEADLSAETRDGVEIVLRANIEFPHETAAVNRYGACGVGLYRSEFLFLSRSPEIPTEEDHYRTYLEIAREVEPYPTVVRTLDLGGEKYFHEVLERDDEANPVLGLRGVRFCLKRPDIFRPQLRGLLRAAAEADIRMMLPLVTIPDEIWAVAEMIAEEAAALKKEGKPARDDVPLGIMIEVPAAALAADILARECDFIAIGTNDLIQYALAAGRGNELVSYLYQPLHPGLLRMLKQIVHSAVEEGIPVSLCGEMGADPEMVGLLIGLGLRELSVQPRALAAVREAVRALDIEEATRMADEALDRPTASEIKRRLRTRS